MNPSGNDGNRRLVEDPEFLAYLMDRFGLIGTAAQWRGRIAELRGRGIDNLFCAAVVPDLDDFIDRVATGVIAQMQ